MTCLQPAIAGDSGDTRIVRLDGINNLDDVSTIAVLVQRQSTRASQRTKATLTATVADSTARTITVELGDAPTGWLAAEPAAGTWDIQYELTMSNGDVITWPNSGYDSIKVYAELDP